MRRTRDFDSELKALQDKARQLKEQKVRQLGELVIATGADTMPLELLAGALITAVASTDMIAKEEWRASGTRFFQARRKGSRRSDHRQLQGGGTHEGSNKPAPGADGAR